MNENPPLLISYAYSLDIVYMHMDLNIKVHWVFSVPSLFLTRSIDPLDGAVLPLAQILSSVF